MASLTSRNLARLAHSNPIAVFDAMYTQLKVYDNLIPIAVDSLRYGDVVPCVAPLCFTVCVCWQVHDRLVV